jgi:uncharacterized protein (TIGR02001 family)
MAVSFTLLKGNKRGVLMKLTHGLAAAALALTAFAAQAEVTGTVTAVSDYNWRGITQTSQDPALRAHRLHDSGFMGAWASNVDFGDLRQSVE